MKDRSDDPSHHERMHLPRSYISLPDMMAKVFLKLHMEYKQLKQFEVFLLFILSI